MVSRCSRDATDLPYDHVRAGVLRTDRGLLGSLGGTCSVRFLVFAVEDRTGGCLAFAWAHAHQRATAAGCGLSALRSFDIESGVRERVCGAAACNRAPPLPWDAARVGDAFCALFAQPTWSRPAAAHGVGHRPHRTGLHGVCASDGASAHPDGVYA